MHLPLDLPPPLLIRLQNLPDLLHHLLVLGLDLLRRHGQFDFGFAGFEGGERGAGTRVAGDVAVRGRGGEGGGKAAFGVGAEGGGEGDGGGAAGGGGGGWGGGGCHGWGGKGGSQGVSKCG